MNEYQHEEQYQYQRRNAEELEKLNELLRSFPPDEKEEIKSVYIENILNNPDRIESTWIKKLENADNKEDEAFYASELEKHRMRRRKNFIELAQTRAEAQADLIDRKGKVELEKWKRWLTIIFSILLFGAGLWAIFSLSLIKVGALLLSMALGIIGVNQFHDTIKEILKSYNDEQ